MPFRYTGDYYRRSVGDYRYQGGLPILGLASAAFPILKRLPRLVKPAAKVAGRWVPSGVKRFFAAPVTVSRGLAATGTAVTAAAAYRGGKRAAERKMSEDGGFRLFDGEEPKRRRRMNVANPKALRRAIRRAQGFAKLARKVLTFTQARAPRGRARFKRRR